MMSVLSIAYGILLALTLVMALLESDPVVAFGMVMVAGGVTVFLLTGYGWLTVLIGVYMMYKGDKRVEVAA